jgi:hypothetical protein
VASLTSSSTTKDNDPGIAIIVPVRLSVGLRIDLHILRLCTTRHGIRSNFLNAVPVASQKITGFLTSCGASGSKCLERQKALLLLSPSEYIE